MTEDFDMTEDHDDIRYEGYEKGVNYREQHAECSLKEYYIIYSHEENMRS